MSAQQQARHGTVQQRSGFSVFFAARPGIARLTGLRQLFSAVAWPMHWLASACLLAGLGLAAPALQAGSYDRLFQAAKVDNDSAIRDLLKAGLDPNLIEEERGDTALILALREDSMRVVTALLAAPGIDLEARARNGDNALMIAAFKANRPAVKALLARGAQVNRPGWTALHYAAAMGDNTILQWLLDKNAVVDALAPNKTTALMMAARGGHILSVKLLLDHGADPLLVNDQGYDAIAMARLFNNKDIIEGLEFRVNKIRKQRESATQADPANSAASANASRPPASAGRQPDPGK